MRTLRKSKAEKWRKAEKTVHKSRQEVHIRETAHRDYSFGLKKTLLFQSRSLPCSAPAAAQSSLTSAAHQSGEFKGLVKGVQTLAVDAAAQAPIRSTHEEEEVGLGQERHDKLFRPPSIQLRGQLQLPILFEGEQELA